MTARRGVIESLRVSFGGSLADIPSLKNQKIPNTNILRPRAKAFLAAMTETYRRATKDCGFSFDPEKYVAGWMELSKRKVSFDEDNPCSTVKDWLEPQLIRGGDRGWGAGIVRNDRKVLLFPIKKGLGLDSGDEEWTDIYLCELAAVADQIASCGAAIKYEADAHPSDTLELIG